MSRARRWCAVAFLLTFLGGCAGNADATGDPFTVERALLSVGYAAVIVLGVVGAHYVQVWGEHNR